MRLRLLAIASVATLSGCDLTDPSTCIEDRQLGTGAFEESIGERDCIIDGGPRDIYQLSTTQDRVVHFEVGSVGTPVRLAITRNSDPATRNLVLLEGGLTEFDVFVALDAGDYTVQILPNTVTGRGNYIVQTTIVTPPDPEGCVTTLATKFYATRGVESAGTITELDCEGDGFDDRTDSYEVRMYDGEARTVTVTASAAMQVELLNGGVLEESASSTGAGTITLSFTPTQSGIYTLRLTADPTAAAVSYTYKIE